MRIDFLGLEAFVSIAERGSFQRAAAHLNLSQTAVSHRMRKLEEELGLKLLARTTREVTLTRAGIDFLPKARKALSELEQSFDDLRQQGAKRRERLDVACLPVFAVNYMPPILRRFHEVMPDVQVRIFETPSAAIAELVESGEVEFGFTGLLTNRWDLDIETFSASPLALACPSGHPLAKKRALGWGEMSGLPLIRVSSRTAIRVIIDDAISAAKANIPWQYEVQHVETAVNLVEAGLGFTVVPMIDVALHRGGGVVAVPLRAPKLSCTYGLVWRRGMPLSPPAATLRDLLAREMTSARTIHALNG
ncbi:MAG TPA: LysR substrate-binding domain-containing protein [Pseudolabrys sp.]|uniref:LysR family transcriptional regulator n=1 Tax=Pseudolabrys sp. TaxID=1960880 RepID=UPI002DDD3FB0|nr:LysR substrate-binding domain-containing protein [Pseudolabrys sp.]HEV2627229.1 LysR substrate-binding domain-containing protein [Pseudolabrys sp.]